MKQMPDPEYQFILNHRLAAHRLAQNRFKRPGDVVSHFGAMQAQDHNHAKWAVGIRLEGGTEKQVDDAIVSKKIIRTTLFRGTLHLVSAQDIRWMLQLVGPRLVRSFRSRYRQLELDAKTLVKSQTILAEILRGNKKLIREEIAQALAQKGIRASGLRLIHILAHACLDQQICQGPKRGSEPTFTLLDETVAPTPIYGTDEALGMLAHKYFVSHGPATMHDLASWSGLTLADVKTGIDRCGKKLGTLEYNGRSYFMDPGLQGHNIPNRPIPDTLLFLPGFDEYYLGYKNRDAVLDPKFTRKVITLNGLFFPVIVVNGNISGVWKRTIKKSVVDVEINWLDRKTKRDHTLINGSVRDYCRFLGLEPGTIKFLKA
jgi:hypothetical protein